jgi:hypothetical protein
MWRGNETQIYDMRILASFVNRSEKGKYKMNRPRRETVDEMLDLRTSRN